MKIYVLASALLALPFRAALAQSSLEVTRQNLLREGMALYTSERASWVATDLLQATTFDTHQIRSYFSYSTPDDSVRTVFVGGPVAAPQVLSAYSFPTGNVRAASAHRSGARPLTEREKQLLAIRTKSMEDVPRVAGFEIPKNASLNPVLLEKGTETWVYVLTGATTTGTVPLGNDYLLRYSTSGKLLHKEKLHSSFIALGPAPVGQKVAATLHTHQPGAAAFITPTDICTLLLYRHQLPGKQHVVLGEKFVSVFTPADASLALLTRKAFEQQQKQP
ncbi:hypothetical protein [Hymenobacter sediminicola]|uniref:Uncharacterized protein n=1 Tax=Hymenobacter sediminicola TaxID=2761579 RepID=A0A7G7WBS8_9BACT|nr:hypothetical protein [Hymenobacter sediminicola]QNH63821.1 hypothetical protein H4317_08510 [Hymenobacter sediminicola]